MRGVRVKRKRVTRSAQRTKTHARGGSSVCGACRGWQVRGVRAVGQANALVAQCAARECARGSNARRQGVGTARNATQTQRGSAARVTGNGGEVYAKRRRAREAERALALT